MTDEFELPRGELMLRTLAMPADTNPAGDIFGGWLLAQMDIAGGLAAKATARGRVATIAVDAMTFHRPVFVGDVVCCYAELEQIGTTSIRFHVQAWAVRGAVGGERVKVTEGTFTFVAIDDERKPRALPGKGDRRIPESRCGRSQEYISSGYEADFQHDAVS